MTRVGYLLYTHYEEEEIRTIRLTEIHFLVRASLRNFYPIFNCSNVEIVKLLPPVLLAHKNVHKIHLHVLNPTFISFDIIIKDTRYDKSLIRTST